MLRVSSAGAVVLTVLAAAGCSDPAASPSVGGATVQLGSSSEPGKSCPSGNPIYLGVNGVGPAGDAKGKPYTDDENGAAVSCSVGSGSEIKFSGLIQKPPGFFSVSGTVTKGGTGKAAVSVYDPGSTDGLTSPSDTPCDVAVDTPPLKVSDETIWASFTCPKLVSSENTSVVCSVYQGWFYFDHCK